MQFNKRANTDSCLDMHTKKLESGPSSSPPLHRSTSRSTSCRCPPLPAAPPCGSRTPAVPLQSRRRRDAGERSGAAKRRDAAQRQRGREGARRSRRARVEQRGAGAARAREEGSRRSWRAAEGRAVEQSGVGGGATATEASGEVEGEVGRLRNECKRMRRGRNSESPKWLQQ